MTSVQKELVKFDPISLSEMDEVALLKRTDIKFALSLAQLPQLLEAAKDGYRVLEIDGKRQMRYRTNYFDTEGLDFYHEHHNQRRPRMKVRKRKYIDSEISFLEIKAKPNTGQTEKQRIRIAEMKDELSSEEVQYVSQRSGFTGDLHLALTNQFNRITLVHKHNCERFTIDFDLIFQLKNREKAFSDVVVAEIKQASASRNTASYQILRGLGIRPIGFSKYCLGTILLHPEIKHNNFKRTLLHLEKL